LKGVALVNIGRNEEALEAFSRSLDLDPKDATVWGNKGDTLIKLGRNEEVN